MNSDSAAVIATSNQRADRSGFATVTNTPSTPNPEPLNRPASTSAAIANLDQGAWRHRLLPGVFRARMRSGCEATRRRRQLRRGLRMTPSACRSMLSSSGWRHGIAAAEKEPGQVFRERLQLVADVVLPSCESASAI